MFKNKQVFHHRQEASMELPIISGTHNFDHFLAPFKHYFSHPQYRNLTHYLLGLLLCEGKRTIARMSRAQATDESYNRLHHFLSDSPWNEEAVNQERVDRLIQTVQERAQEKTEPIGFLIGDDTTNPKTGKEMAGFGFNHSTVHDDVIRSQSVVATLYHFEDLDIPLYPSLYKSESYCEQHEETFKTKNELMVEQIEKVKLPKGIRSIGLFDSWYFNSIVLAGCKEKGIEAIGRLKDNRRAILSLSDPIGTRLDDWFNFLRSHKQHPFKRITVRDNEAKKRELWTYHWTGFVKNLGLVQLVVVSDRIRGKNVIPAFIATTDLNLSVEQIICFYFKRWSIETFFWTQKERLGFNDYQVRPERSAKRHWLLCFLAHSYLVTARKTAGSRKGATLGDFQRLEQRENFRRLVAHIHSKVKERGHSVDTIYYELAA
jgi:hypothetical protein